VSDKWVFEKLGLTVHTKTKMVGAAFGNPKKEHVYSGLAKYMFEAVEKKVTVASYLSTKLVRPWDVFDGAADFSKITKYGRPCINFVWLWRKKTVDKLTRRFKAHLKNTRGFNTVLQAGAIVRVELDGVRHYCITDMTVAQGIEEKVFGLDKLKEPRISEAIEAQRSIFENCDSIFAASNWAKQSIVADYGIDQNRVFVTSLGASVSGDVDIDNKRPNFNILFMGRNWQVKGGPMAVEAFKRVNERIPKSTLTIIGCSPKISHPNVKVLGHLDKTYPRQMSTIADAFRNATVLCVPSAFDAFGFCYVEAQYYGVVPVTFAGQGRSESIRDGLTGVLVAERSPEALSEAILELLRNPDKTREMSIAGYKFCRAHCTWDRVAEKIVRVVEGAQ
jgi:glycosyltransferase involved in cell wall biosynthesis